MRTSMLLKNDLVTIPKIEANGRRVTYPTSRLYWSKVNPTACAAASRLYR
jgi:hypothetical protein